MASLKLIKAIFLWNELPVAQVHLQICYSFHSPPSWVSLEVFTSRNWIFGALFLIVKRTVYTAYSLVRLNTILMFKPNAEPKGIYIVLFYITKCKNLTLCCCCGIALWFWLCYEYSSRCKAVGLKESLCEDMSVWTSPDLRLQNIFRATQVSVCLSYVIRLS